MPPILPDKSSALSCRQTVQLLPDYLDHRLNSPKNDLVRMHLQGCNVCSAEMSAQLVSETALISAAQKISAPDDLLAQFSMRLAAQKRETRSSWRRPLILAPLAAVGLILWLGSHRREVLVNTPASQFTQSARSKAPMPNEVLVKLSDKLDSHISRNKTSYQVAQVDRVESRIQSAPILRKMSNSASPNADLHTHLILAKHGIEIALNSQESTADGQSSIRMPASIRVTNPNPISRVVANDPVPEVDLVVHDEERGFTASSRIARLDSVDGDFQVVRFTDVDAPALADSPLEEAE